MARFVFKVFVVFCVCSVALFAAKAPEDKCYFPPYNKEARYCKIYTDTYDETECKEVKLESGYDEWVTNLKDLFDKVEVVTPIREFKRVYVLENITLLLIGTLSIGSNDDYVNTDIREATECNGKSCTTKGYDDKGMLIYEANCISGVNHGTQRFYDKSQGLIMELNYNQGKLDGKQKIPQSLNANDYADEEFIINDVVVKNGKLNGEIYIKKEDKKGDKKDYVTLHGKFKNGKPISTLKLDVIGGDKSLDGSLEIKIPFDTNNMINGEVEVVYIVYKNINVQNQIIGKANFKNSQLISFDLKLENEESEFSLKSDIAALCSHMPDYKSIQKMIDSVVDEEQVRGYIFTHKIWHFNDKGQKTGKWIEKEDKYYEGSIIEICGNKLKNYSKTLESNYENDKLNGAQKEWLNGKLIKETMYENDELNGTLKEWDNNGNLIKAEIYKNGNRVQIIR